MMYFSTVSQLTAFELAGSRNRLRRCGDAADWLLRVIETDSQFEWWDVSAASLTAWTSGLDRSLNMHNHTHRHLLQLKFSDRTVSKPHRHIGQHPFRYHRRRKEEERKEGKRRNFTLTHTLACLWWCWPQRSWMMQLLFSFPPFSLLLLLEVCVCVCVYWKLEVERAGFWRPVQVMWLMQSDLISCKCKGSEGIHFGLRAPLCTAYEILSAVSLFVHRCH